MSESRTKNSTRNLIFSLMNQLTALFLQFLLRTVFIRTLGVEFLGVNGLFGNVISLLNMVDLGIGTAMVYSFYKPLAEQDFEKISLLLSYYRKIYRAIAVIVTLLGFALIPFLKYIIHLDKEIPHLYFYYILTVLNTSVSYLFAYKSCVLTADQRQYIITRYQMLISIARTVLQVILLLTFHSYSVFLLVGIGGTLLQNLLAAKAADRLYPLHAANKTLPQEDKDYIKKNISAMFVYKIASTVFNGTDNILLSALFGTVQVGIYSNYLLIIQYLSNIVGNVFTSATASVGNSIVTDSPGRRLEIFHLLQTVSHMIGIFFSVELFLLINDFILCWLGPSYLFDSLTVIAVLMNFLMDCAFQPIWCFRNAAGIFLKLKYIMSVAALLNLLLSIVLSRYLGIAGIFFATSLARLLSYFWYEPGILFRDFFAASAACYYTGWIKYLVSAIGIGLIQLLLFGRMDGTSWSQWLWKATVSSVLTIGMILVLYHQSHGFQILKEKIVWFFQKRNKK